VKEIIFVGTIAARQSDVFPFAADDRLCSPIPAIEAISRSQKANYHGRACAQTLLDDVRP
jgi:hypothetical protein